MTYIHNAGGFIPPFWLPEHAFYNPVNALAYAGYATGGVLDLTHDYFGGLSNVILPPASHSGLYNDVRGAVNFGVTSPFHALRGAFHAFGDHGWNKHHATDHLSAEVQGLSRTVTSHFRR